MKTNKVKIDYSIDSMFNKKVVRIDLDEDRMKYYFMYLKLIFLMQIWFFNETSVI